MRKYQKYLILLAAALGFVITGFLLNPPKKTETITPTISPTAAVQTEPQKSTEAPTQKAVTPTPIPQKTQTPAKETLSPATPAPTEALTESPQAATCTVLISCESVLSHLDQLSPEKQALIPKDGMLLSAEKTEIFEGESAFDLLKRITREHKIHLEFSLTPVTKSAYIEGIGNLYEFDLGELSGWMYRVNGEFPGFGASNYTLHAGDTVEWLYTCDLGRDIGSSLSGGGQHDE